LSGGIERPAGPMNPAVRAWLSRHRPAIRLSLQMTVAGLAAFAVGHLFALSQV
jgi:hypothetical protein